MESTALGLTRLVFTSSGRDINILRKLTFSRRIQSKVIRPGPPFPKRKESKLTITTELTKMLTTNEICLTI